MLIALAVAGDKTVYIEIGGADDSRHSTKPDHRSLLTLRPPAPTVSTHP
ncbi:hypothetical protein MITS9509_01846 [Synechococcus sp. MIT S9509]|nr:hypothetical protein MITS9504_01644 [Synechococcus sp. MIT S9504]KZR91925.1 hypothetical protein MITS9509_01846 [Synechococcus sp. MIT S9509]